MHPGSGRRSVPSLHRARLALGLLSALALLGAGGARAEGAGKVWVLKAARLFDGRSDRSVSPGVVVVRDGVIADLGPDAAIPEGAEVVDLGDSTLLPGLIDSHVHLTGEASPDWYRDSADQLLRLSSEQALRATVYARRTLEAGITTVRDLGASDLLNVALRNAIDQGRVVGPHMLVAAWPMGARGGHMDDDPVPPGSLKQRGPAEGICNGADECRAAVRWQCRRGADVIKIAASGGVLSLTDSVDAPQMTLDEMRAIVDEAHRLGRKVAAHSHGDAAARLAAEAGVDSIEHGTFLGEQTLGYLKKKGTWLVPTLMTGLQKMDAFPPAIVAKDQAANAARAKMIHAALRLGVKIAMGTDSGVTAHGQNAHELQLLVDAGQSPAQALRASTSLAAELLGVAGKTGALAKGLTADVIAVPGDPLEKISAVEQVSFVMISGRVQKRPGPQKATPRLLLVKAARLFDATSDALIEDGAVLVEGRTIKAVGKGLAAPEGAEVIDLGDATLLPGLIDAHVHLTGEASENWAKDLVDRVQRLPAESTLWGAQLAERTLRSGFTTVRNLGAAELTDVALRNGIEQGLVPGPRMLVAAWSIGSTGGHADGGLREDLLVEQRSPRTGICNGADECRAAVRWQLKHGADVIKLIPSGGVLSLTDPVDVPQLTAEEMKAIVDEAHAWHKKTAAHCHGDLAARLAVEAGVDSIEHGSFLKPETLALMKQRGTVLVPTLSALETVGRKAEQGHLHPLVAEKARAAAAVGSDMFRTAVKLGVKIVLGTDAGVQPHGHSAHELVLMGRGGLGNAAALRAGTSGAAELLGLSQKLGTLEAGKLADLVAVPGNPLVDLAVTERVLFVMKDGAVVVR